MYVLTFLDNNQMKELFLIFVLTMIPMVATSFNGKVVIDGVMDESDQPYRLPRQ